MLTISRSLRALLWPQHPTTSIGLRSISLLSSLCRPLSCQCAALLAHPGRTNFLGLCMEPPTCSVHPFCVGIHWVFTAVCRPLPHVSDSIPCSAHEFSPPLVLYLTPTVMDVCPPVHATSLRLAVPPPCTCFAQSDVGSCHALCRHPPAAPFNCRSLAVHPCT